MKLSEKTLAILKNYATINPSILIRNGNTLRTMSPKKTVVSCIDVAEVFPCDIGILDLNKFLGVLSMFEDPDLKFHEKYVEVGDGTTKMTYVYSAPNLFIVAPDKDLKLPSEDVTFKVTAAQITNVLKAASVMGLPDISFKGEGGVLSMIAHEKKNSSSHVYKIGLGECDIDFEANYKAESFKIVADTYEVKLSKKMISQFSGESGVTYWIVCEGTSKF